MACIVQEVRADTNGFKDEEPLNALVCPPAAEDRRDSRPGSGHRVHHTPEVISI